MFREKHSRVSWLHILAWASALPSDIDRAMREASKSRTATDTDSCAFFVFVSSPDEGSLLGYFLNMKNRINLSLVGLGMGMTMTMMLVGCHSAKQYLESSTPQEHTIRPVKITDETQNSVCGNKENLSVSSLNTSGYGGYRDKGFVWAASKRLVISPDGNELAYISIVEEKPNIMIKKVTPGGSSTQRSFRRAESLAWGPDGNLYFNDNTGNTSQIGKVDAHKGSLIKQLTTNNNDWAPAITKDGEIMYFTRYDASGPSIWSLNMKTGELSNCGRGFDPEVFGNAKHKVLCARNSSKGNTEIWLLDFENGDETLILSDTSKGFSNPTLSPDGRWVLLVANSHSDITKKQNTDIYAVRPDGTQLTQITYHPEVDCCPVWSPDGKYIYFISSRANKDRRFNIWRIENPLN